MATPERWERRDRAIRRVQESSPDWGDLTPPVVEVHNHIEKRDSSPALPPSIPRWLVKAVLALVALGGALWKALR